MSTLDPEDRFALDQAVSLVREVIDKHVMQLSTQIIQRLEEAINDIQVGRLYLEAGDEEGKGG